MKFTRSTWISLFVVLLVVGATTLGVMYNSANKAHKLAQDNLNAARISETVLNKNKSDLAAQLTQAAADVSSWNDKITLLQTELGQAQLSLTQTQNNFPTSAQTIEYNETLMKLAASSNLTMHLLVATEPANVSLAGSSYTFASNVFTIQVSGKVSDILDFVDKIATSGDFKTSAMTPLAFNIPQPLSQAAKDQMRADIKANMVANVSAGLTGDQKVGMIEKGLLELLSESTNPTSPTLDEMTQKIISIIAEFNQSDANLLSEAIANAIQNNLADNLISTVAQVYSDYITALFTADDTAGLLPIFTGPLGDKITAAIQDIPTQSIPSAITQVITDALNSKVADQTAAMVSDSAVDTALTTQVTAIEMPSAQLTVAVYSYKGE